MSNMGCTTMADADRTDEQQSSPTSTSHSHVVDQQSVSSTGEAESTSGRRDSKEMSGCYRFEHLAKFFDENPNVSYWNALSIAQFLENPIQPFHGIRPADRHIDEHEFCVNHVCKVAWSLSLITKSLDDFAEAVEAIDTVEDNQNTDHGVPDTTQETSDQQP